MSNPTLSPAATATGAEQAVLAPHRPLHDFYPEAQARAGAVQKMFDESAPHYDRISRVLSFGSDTYYRRRALQQAGLKAGMRLLDVATGTGLVLSAALSLGVAPEDAVGVDPSAGMLAENRQRQPAGVTLVQGYGEKLPFEDRSFDFITMGYALRHVEDLHALFREFRRVLRPGGRVLILEISRPESPLKFAFMKLYMGRVVPWLTRVLTKRDEPARLMEYYWATVAECVAPATIVQAMGEAGLVEVQRRTTGGVLNDYSAVNPAS